jgi:hypothetical protein
MLTRAKHKHGEGTFKTFNPEVVRASQRKKMVEEGKHVEQEKKFHMVFYRMLEIVKRMYGDYKKRMEKKGKKNKAQADDNALMNQEVGGDYCWGKTPYELANRVQNLHADMTE